MDKDLDMDLPFITDQNHYETDFVLNSATEQVSHILPILDKRFKSSEYIIGYATLLMLSVQANRLLLAINDLRESIDCAGVIAPVFWMQSDLAAIDKAKELGIKMLPEYSMADLRYLIDCALREVL